MTKSFRVGLSVAALLIGVIATSTQIAPQKASAALVVNSTVNYSGVSTNFTVPTGVTSLRITARGGAGGDFGMGAPGRGGQVVFTVAVTPGDILKFEVGGRGAFSSTSAGAINSGAWPDGGDGKNENSSSGAGGGGSTRIYKMNGSTPILLAVAAAGGGATDSGDGGGGGAQGSGGGSGSPGMGLPANPDVKAGGASISVGGNGACLDFFNAELDCGGSGSSLQGGDVRTDLGGGGGGGGYFGGGAGAVGYGGGGGSSWWDSSKVTYVSDATAVNGSAGSIALTYTVPELIDSTYSLSWQTNGRIGLSASAISSGPAVNGTYALYDSATVTGSPIASVPVNGNGDNALGTTVRTLLSSTRFAVRFTSNNASYSTQNWENLRVKCGPGSYNATDGYIPCTPASLGKFVAYEGSTSETACPNGFTTVVIGSMACISATTQSPSLTSPNSGAAFRIGTSNPSITFRIPETPAAGTVTLRLVLESDSTTYRRIVLADTTGDRTIPAFDALMSNNSLSSLQWVLSSETKIANVTDLSSRLPAGYYTFIIAYQNANLRPVSTATATGVNLQIRCAAGWYSSDGYTPCNPATAGHYASSDNTSNSRCDPGTYQPNSGQTSCIQAAVGSYVDQAGAVTQTACPAGSTTTSLGSIACISTSPVTTTPVAPSATVPVVTKSAPALPTTAKSVTVKKTFTIKAKKSLTTQGLPIKVSTSTKKNCSVAKNSSGYVVKGLKKGSCKISLIVTGNSLYQSITVVRIITVK